MEQYRKSAREVLAEVGRGERGLTREEAEARLTRRGRNVLETGKKKSKIGLFFSQFKDLMTVILIAAAALSGVLAFLTRDTAELVDTGILLFIILLNAVVGFLQEYRADSALEKLKKLARCEAKVVRDGKIVKIDAEELVPGDIVEIEEGDRIPADCRILSSEDLRCDESALTGESLPVKKFDCIVSKNALAERRNTVFSSTYCVRGNARCVVVATGMETEMGRIAALLKGGEEIKSPLDRIITRLGKIITVSVLVIAAILFVGGLLSGRVGFLQNLMSAVAVAVAAIPEGMGAVVTVILAMGVQRMAGRRAVMRKLSAVEALGSCSVICTDKTGTLTENRMHVEEVGTEAQEELLRCIRACHTVKGTAGSYIGDSTEIALLEYADSASYQFAPTHVGGTPFTSERKMMSVLVTFDGMTRLYAKGGADILLKKCTKILKRDGLHPLGEADRRAIEAACLGYSARAMRVLAFAYGERAEEDLVFLGLAAMLDPPKKGAAEAVRACREAGVKTVMITGDSAETAFAIAERLGIAADRSEVVTGEEIDDMGSENFANSVSRYAVYARVSPKHKSEIVEALRARGEVVAMTGDGINDAPALRAADIGVAMGSGTDVTKNAADIIISDDDFSTIVGAVEEGRNVFFNVKKTISFFLATNLAEVLCVLIVSLFLWRYDFLTSTQLLWINLITDSLPVLALGVERTEGAMRRPPTRDSEIYSAEALFEIALFGVLQTAILVTTFVFAVRAWGNGVASTMAFAMLSFLELFYAFVIKSDDTMSEIKSLFSNRALLVTVAFGILMTVLLIATPVRVLFDLTALAWNQWAVVFGLSLVVIPLGMLYRTVRRGSVRRVRAKRPAPALKMS